MHGIGKLALLVVLSIVSICSCEARPDPAPKAEPAPPTIIKAPPSNTDALTGVGPSGAQGRAARRQAVLDLLSDGRTAESLQLTATEPGTEFDPGLAEKLAPKVWVSNRPRSRSAGHVKLGKPTIQGPLDKDIIQRTARSHINQLRSCYDAGLSKDPKLAGEVTINLVIVGTGRVGSSVVEKTTLPGTEVGNCFAKAVKRWLFPSPRGGGNVIVSYPFRLSRD